MTGIRDHLERRFENYRVVFWHDAEGQYAAEFESLDLPGAQTIRVANDEYVIKNLLLHDEPMSKFLVYRSGHVPTGIGNWLLDLELAYGVFTADRTALIAQDLGLTGEGIDEVVQPHEKFFNAKGAHTKYDALVDYELDDFYWRGVASIYGHESVSPSIDAFMLWIFRKAIDGFKSDRPGGFQNIQLDCASLRNDRRSQEALATLAKRAARDLDYASTIEDSSFRDLTSVDLFEETDQKIISDLACAVAERTVTAREVAAVVRARQTSVWIDGCRQLYRAIATASELLASLASLDLAAESFDDALERYRREWFRIDQLYRQFIFVARTAEYPNPLEALRSQDRNYAIGT